MRVMTIFGTRPEIIRLSLVIKILDQHCEHIMVHTGQNFEESLSDVFFRELEIRTPDVHLGIRASGFAEQAGEILKKADALLAEHNPDRLLILGDTNSALSAIAAARRGIPVFHLEAGNRCYDDRVPEEINRRIIDHSSTVFMPYTERSRQNLLRERFDSDRIYVTGNPIKEVIDSVDGKISGSQILEGLAIRPFEYFLATLHRAENVDSPERLVSIFSGLQKTAQHFSKPVLVTVHPRTADKLAQQSLRPDPDRVRLLKPLGFLDFIKLERHALAVLTDSGTVQEECAIFAIPNVTIRDVTERPETIECGSNILAGGEPDAIVRAVELALAQPAAWRPPEEYLRTNVSQTVSKIVLGHLSRREHHA
jgi:UDP-N-acetylglucosamine 2-epimerase (non-hydrolysing)